MEVESSSDLISSSSLSCELEKRCARKRSSIPADSKLLCVTSLAMKLSSSVLDFALTSWASSLPSKLTNSQIRIPSVYKQSANKMSFPYLSIHLTTLWKSRFCTNLTKSSCKFTPSLKDLTSVVILSTVA